MNVYSYIAESNPDACFEICKKYGFFQVADLNEMSETMQTIVGKGNEEALKDIMDLHPDKGVILELFEKGENGAMTKAECDTKLNADGLGLRLRRRRMMMGVDASKGSASQTNTYILVGAIIVALAIVSSIKK